MYRSIAVALVILLVTACGTETTELPQDLIPVAERDYSFQEEQEDELHMDVPDVLKEFVGQLARDGQLTSFDSVLYLNRFGPEQRISFIRSTSSDSAEWHVYQFSDSLKTINAFYNWLDCFGSDCLSLSIGQQAKMKGRPGQVVVTANRIIAVYFLAGKSSYDSSFWDELLGETPYLYMVSWKKNGKLNWTIAEEIDVKS
jgi:hypothetical protein